MKRSIIFHFQFTKCYHVTFVTFVTIALEKVEYCQIIGANSGVYNNSLLFSDKRLYTERLILIIKN